MKRLAINASIALSLGLGLTLAMLWLLTGPPQVARADATPVHYVAPTGADSPDCTDPANPCQTVQYAVDQAGDGDEVRVATGAYTGVSARAGVTQVVYISKTVTTRGGYSADFSAWDPAAYTTTLDAGGQGRVIYISGDITPTIEGLRIAGGNATGLGGDPWGDVGGGVYVITAAATIRNNMVFSNAAVFGGGGLYLRSSDATLDGNAVIANAALGSGAGLYLYASDATLSGNTVIANLSFLGSGGGLYLDASDATLSGNTVSSNFAFLGSGGGLYLDTSDATLSGNTIIANAALFGSGGGLYLVGSAASLTNNVVADNQATGLGSGIYVIRSSPRLLHTTIARNGGGDGSGVYVTDDGFGIYSNVALTNTILVSHTVGVSVTAGSTATLEATLWGSNAWANGADWDDAGWIFTGTVNVQGNPVFADPDGGDYHIGLASAARDAGVGAGVNDDIDGDPRGITPDIGADEYAWYIRLPLVLRNY